MSDRTVRLHRVLRVKPEKVYRAFLEANAMAKWIPPYGFTCTVHHMDARVGGSFRSWPHSSNRKPRASRNHASLCGTSRPTD